MSLITDILNETLVKVIGGFGEIIDDLHTSTEEKLEAKRKVTELLLTHQVTLSQLEAKLDEAYLTTSTDRHKYDMQSDNKLSKNIRPLAFLIVLGATLGFTFLDGFAWFVVQEAWIDVWQGALMAFIVMYTGVRGLEKMVKIRYAPTATPEVAMPDYNQYNKDQIAAERAEIHRQRKQIEEERERLLNR